MTTQALLITATPFAGRLIELVWRSSTVVHRYRFGRFNPSCRGCVNKASVSGKQVIALMSQSQEAQASANGAAPCANQVCMRLRDFRPESRPQSSSLEPRLLNTLCPPAAFSSSIRQPRLLGLINTLRARYLLLTCSTTSALLCPTTSILLQAVVLSAILTALCFSGRNQS